MSATFLVRPLQPEDIEPLIDLRERVAAEGRWIGAEAPLDRERSRARLAELVSSRRSFASGAPRRPSERVEGFVAEAATVPIGEAHIRGAALADLAMLVAPEWRGKGVGSALVEQCIAWARGAGAHKIALQVWPHNTAAIALYERFGFEREGYLRRHWRRRNGDLWDAVVMGLLLEDEGPRS